MFKVIFKIIWRKWFKTMERTGYGKCKIDKINGWRSCNLKTEYGKKYNMTFEFLMDSWFGRLFKLNIQGK